MKYLFIDIRKSDEVYAKHFDESQEYSFYNIPMDMIRFNAQTIINHLEYIDEIYLEPILLNNKYKVDNLINGVVTGSSNGTLGIQPINGTGNIVATTAATGLVHSG